MADRKISDLTALTTPASGDFLPIVDISEAAAASKNKRITIEELMRGMPDGTAAAPGIAFEDDPNTGIYSPGADQVAISTNGTGRLFVDSIGRVGAGISSPGATIHAFGAPAEIRVESSTSSDGFIRFINTSGSMSIGMTGAALNGFLLADRTNNHVAYQYIGGAAGAHIWNTDNTERLRITSAGNVGIGTSSPQSLLHLEGGTATQNLIASSGNAVFRMADSVTGGTRKEFTITLDNTNNRVDIQAVQQGVATRNITLNAGGGNVGIGTTSPSTILQVVGAPGTSTTANLLSLRNGSASNAGNIAQIDFWCANSFGGNEPVAAIQALNPHAGANNGGALVLAVSSLGTATTPSERARITSAGLVGIGTSAPNTLLHVLGGDLKVQRDSSNFVSVSEITLSNVYRTGRILSSYTNPSSIAETYIAFHTNRTGQSNDIVGEAMRIAGGNVGIGTSSPQEILHANGNIRLTNGAGFTTANSTVAKIGAFAGSANQFDLAQINFLTQSFSDNGQISFSTASASTGSLTEAVRIDSSQRVGIGTTSPGSILTLNDPGTGLSFVNAASGNYNIGLLGGTGSADAYVFNRANSPLILGTNNAERLRITSAGLVGIGTSAPNARLHVADGQIKVANSGAINPTIIFTGSSAGASGFQVGQRYNAQELFIYDTAALVDRVIVDSSGRVGIGTTSPSSLLHLADAGHITVGSSTGTKIGTATTQKIGFFDKTPVVQPTAVADATDAATAITQLNALLTRMRNLGLIAT